MGSESAGRPLLVTDDVDLLDDLLRLSAAAHVETEVASSLTAATSRWNHAPVVVVGADAGRQLVEGNLPRRSDVLLVGNDKTPARWDLATELGATQVVDLPGGEVWLAERLADGAAPNMTRAPIIAVLGARGGVGATSFAGALVCTAQQAGIGACAVDLDPAGMCLDLALGGPVGSGLTWAELDRTRGRVPPAPLLAGLARVNGIPLLTWGSTSRLPPAVGALGAVLDSLRLATGLVVLDLPRSQLDHCLEGISRSDQLLLVVPRNVGGVRAAARMVATSPLAGAPVRLVVRGYGRAGLDTAEVGELLGMPVAASIASDPAIARNAELGIVPVTRRRSAMGRACRPVLAGVDFTGLRG